ncbi:MAG: antitoxin family protein [Cyanothece sp. SIO2G6]|nr:antitoxin family protein [Cyanothece sp. SIO2G6]
MQQILDAIYENGQFRPLQVPDVVEGQTVKIIVSTIVAPNSANLDDAALPMSYQPASGRSLLRHAGTWVGDDFEECLQSMYDSRSRADFSQELEPFE